jgi:hypothetical protein
MPLQAGYPKWTPLMVAQIEERGHVVVRHILDVHAIGQERRLQSPAAGVEDVIAAGVGQRRPLAIASRGG